MDTSARPDEGGRTGFRRLVAEAVAAVDAHLARMGSGQVKSDAGAMLGAMRDHLLDLEARHAEGDFRPRGHGGIGKAVVDGLNLWDQEEARVAEVFLSACHAWDRIVERKARGST